MRPRWIADRIRSQLVRDMGETVVAQAEAKAREKPMRLEPMGDKAKLAKIEDLVRGGTVEPRTAGAILQILGVKP